MSLNPVQCLVYAAALACFWYGRRLALISSARVVPAIAFGLCAVPAICYDLYYLHVWDEPIWLYRIRSWPASELLAAPAGLLAGWSQGSLRGRWRVSMASACLLLLAALFVPYAKQFAAPLPMTERWKDGVCLQSTPSTCGPASAATLLSAWGVPVSEAELAREAYSTWSGTENWYLRRAIERRGISCEYVFTGTPPVALPYPSIAGLRLGPQSGHFIAILGPAREGGGYDVADPLYGRGIVRQRDLQDGPRCFSGFFLVLHPPME